MQNFPDDDSQPLYRWSDERSGVWTSIEELPERVEITLTGTYRRGSVADVLFMGLGSYVFFRFALPMPPGIGREVGLFAGCSILAMLFAAMRGKKELFNRFPVVIFDAAAKHPQSNEGRCFTAGEVEFVLVRENWRRQNTDSKLCQIYLLLREHEYAEIIYQRYSVEREQVIECAKRLAGRWQTELRVEAE